MTYGMFRRRLFERFDKSGKYTEDREDKLGRKCNVDENDLWIAAQAAGRNLALVTLDKMSVIKTLVDDDVRIITWPDD